MCQQHHQCREKSSGEGAGRASLKSSAVTDVQTWVGRAGQDPVTGERPVSHGWRRGNGLVPHSSVPSDGLGMQLRTCLGAHPAPLPEAGRHNELQIVSTPCQGSVVAGQRSQDSVLGAHWPVPQPHHRLEMPWVTAWPHIATRAKAGRNGAPVIWNPPPKCLSLAGNATKGNCGQKDLLKVLLFHFKGDFKMKIPHFQLS